MVFNDPTQYIGFTRRDVISNIVENRKADLAGIH